VFCANDTRDTVFRITLHGTAITDHGSGARARNSLARLY
jgi:hypothetical protein